MSDNSTRLPQLALGRHADRADECLFLSDKRTFDLVPIISVIGSNRKSARRKERGRAASALRYKNR